MKAIAVIPARGGSKRIPRKNIKEFCGKPIIAYSIEAAKLSNLFDRIIVSTDDEEIADISIKYGAEIPFFRPKDLSDDYTGTNAVVQHALRWHEGENIFFQYACCLYATAPFIHHHYLEDAYRKLIASRKSYVFSVTSFEYPIQRAIKLNLKDEVKPFFPYNIPKRSQDLEEAFHDAGQFYWGKAEAYLNGLPLFTDKSVAFILPKYRVQDIDTIEDWQKAELMFKALLTEKETIF